MDLMHRFSLMEEVVIILPVVCILFLERGYLLPEYHTEVKDTVPEYMIYGIHLQYIA